MINWKRVLRTAIQSGAGAGIALITAISADYSREAIIAAIVSFATTTIIAVLMNIEKQAAALSDDLPEESDDESEGE